MRNRRRRRPEHQQTDGGFFPKSQREHATSTTDFFGPAQEESEREEVTQGAEREEEVSNQAEDETEAVEQSTEEETLAQEREEEAAAQEAEEEAVAQDREEEAQQSPETEEETAAQSHVAATATQTTVAQAPGPTAAPGAEEPTTRRTGSGEKPDTEPAVSIRDDILQTAQSDPTVEALASAIAPAQPGERTALLADHVFMRELRNILSWDKFISTAELLGRRAPSGNEMIADSGVQAVLSGAWSRSQPTDPTSTIAKAETTHEEGGWIYIDVVTGKLRAEAATPGSSSRIRLNEPPVLQNAVLVGVYHTHPNIGGGWAASPSETDVAFARHAGIPLLTRSYENGSPRDYVAPPPAPQRRASLSRQIGLAD